MTKLFLLNTFFLTLNSPTLPNRIKAAYLSCPVRPYIPNPLRCFQCQRYGHAKTSCRGSVTCARCAEVGHEIKHARTLNVASTAEETTQHVQEYVLNGCLKKRFKL